MSIESNSQPNQSAEFKPYLVGDATPDEIAARELLLAPDIDYTVTPVEHEDTPPSQVSDIVVPQLRADGETIEEKEFEDGLLKADQIPQLEPLEPARSEPRYRL